VKIVSLQPFVTDILSRLEAGRYIVGVTHLDQLSAEGGGAVVVTKPTLATASQAAGDQHRLAAGLTRYSLDLEKLKKLEPDMVLASVGERDKVAFVTWASEHLTRELGRPVSVRDVSIERLDDLYQVIEELGGLVGDRAEARAIGSKIKAQLMSWADSFFERCRGKQVVVLSEIKPLTIEGRWFPDLIKLFGGKNLERTPLNLKAPFTWRDVTEARVDVIVVAPEGCSLEDSVKTLPVLQKLPGWDDLPAVKRGEVIFAPGTDMYRPGPRFLKGAAIVVSAMAGLDSGYITERDEYVKVRYLELHRHRYLR